MPPLRLAPFSFLVMLFLLTTSAAPATPITDPHAFVAEVYRQLAAKENYDPPGEDAAVYTPRLKALFLEDRRRSGGEVGCLDFDFWVNGRDRLLKNIRVTSRDVAGHPELKEVIATFLNTGKPQEIHFDFKQVSGAWLLDDVRSVKAVRYTLSDQLKCWDRLPRRP